LVEGGAALNRGLNLRSWFVFVSAVVAAALPGWAQTTFTPTTIDPTNSGDCKALADIDGDGLADPILGGGSLSWYESGSAYAKHVIRATTVYKEFTTDMQAADVDGDGDVDLIVPDGAGPNNVLWFENPRINPPAGHGSDPRVGSNWVYHIVGSHGEHAHDVEVADLDNDGKLDIVTSGHGRTHVWKQVNPTTWTDVDLSSRAGSGVYIGDIDRDGRRDIATPDGWIRTPGNLVTGNWVKYPISGTVGDECLLADLNGDGRTDLIVCDAHNAAEFAWFEAPADPTSPVWTKRVIDAAAASHHPGVADFNLDGRMDILMGRELNSIAVYFNQVGTPPTFVRQQVDSCCGHNARIGDINGDGKPDIFACDYIGNPPAKVYISQTTVGACYANCDGSVGAPILNVLDFSCFIGRYVSGDSRANCDGSTTPPVLNILDFQCFLTRFAAGCP